MSSAVAPAVMSCIVQEAVEPLVQFTHRQSTGLTVALVHLSLANITTQK
jgi:hypothetical protein